MVGDASSNVIDVKNDVEDVEDVVDNSLVIADDLATVWRQP